MVTEGSFYLYDALDENVYFREDIILVPPEWNSTNFTKARTESFGKVHIIMPFYLAYQILMFKNKLLHLHGMFLRPFLCEMQAKIRIDNPNSAYCHESGL